MAWSDFPERPIAVDTPVRVLVRNGRPFPGMPAPTYKDGTRCTPDDPQRTACVTFRVFAAVGHQTGWGGRS